VTTPGRPRLLRSINDRSAMELLLTHGPVTRAQLSELTGLSKPTTGQLLSRLVTAGAVVRHGRRTGVRGPQPETYRLDPSIGYAIGLDVTPVLTRAAVADITGEVLGTAQFRTPRGNDTAELSVRDAVDQTMGMIGLNRKHLTAAVIGTPGALDPITGRLGYARHLRGWHGTDLPNVLRNALGAPVSLVNDVKLAAVAELAARGPHERDFCLLWNGEGLGLAHVSDGQVLAGARGGAGEVGYMPVPGTPVQRRPRRTNSGGFQTRAGAPAVRRVLSDAGFGARDAAVGLRRAVTAADAGNRAAARAVREVAERLAVGLAAICCVLDPPVIVLTGDICAAGGTRLAREIESELAELTINAPPVRGSVVTEQPVLRGAIHAAVEQAREIAFAEYLN
jgi:predicted NBD/HSP70 family sugar kinase